MATADTETGHENQILTLDVLANDTDEDHNDNTANLSLDNVQIVDGDGNPVSGQGTVSIVNNQLQFVPGSDFDSLSTGESTTVTVRYVVSDNEGATSESTASITLTGTNDDPVAHADTQTIQENETLTLDVLANDTDVDHNDSSANFSLDSVQIVDGDGNPVSGQGTVSIVNNQLQFVPGNDFDSLVNGETATVTVRYVMSDNDGATSESTATLTVTGSNDAPLVANQSFNVNENVDTDGSFVVGTVAASDVDAGQSKAYTITAGNDDSKFAIDSTTGEITVVGGLDHEVADSYNLTVQVADDGSPSLSDTATITIGVNDLNEAPVDIALAADAGVKPATPEVQASWEFDNNYNSESGENSFSGSSPAFIAGPNSRFSNAITFDGSASDFKVPLDVSETAYTVSFWFKADNAGGLLQIQSSAHTSHDRNIFLNANGTISSRLWSEETVTSTPGEDYNDGQWHHVAHTFGGSVGGQVLYVDGSEVASGSKVSSNFTSQSHLRLGYSTSGNTYLDGAIAGLQVFDEAVTGSQIPDLMAGVAGADAIINESSTTAVSIGALTVSDQDNTAEAFGQHTYTVSDSRFEVAAGELRLKAGQALDYETEPTISVNVTATDENGSGFSFSKNFTIQVRDNNDVPIASADTQTIHENETLTLDVLANDTDEDHSDTTANFSLDSVQIVDGDGNPVSGQGTVSIVNNQLQFVPGSDFDSLATGETATVTVRYVMSDNEGATSESTATITVTGTNDAPVASADIQTIHENETLTLDVLANDMDEDHNDSTANFSLDSVQIVDGDGNPVNGQGTVSIINNQLQFVPGSDFDSLATGETETVTVRYIMSDDEGATSESTATLTATGTNDAPVASVDTQTIHENETLTLDVLANDTDGDHNDNTANFSLDSVQIVDGDGNPVSGQGTVSIVNNQLQFVPGSDFDSLATGETATVTVRYIMSDDEGATSESTATFTVTGTNDDPIARADTEATQENETLTLDVLANDTDEDHSDTTANFSLDSVQIVDGDGNPVSGQGAVSIVNNQLQFVPGSDFDSLATGETATVIVRYVMSDNEGSTSESTATITVTGTNDAPVASADTQTIHENETLTLNVLANDTDKDHNDSAANFSLDSVQIVDSDGNSVSGQGTVSVVNNQLQFVPGSDFDSLATGETATVIVRYVMSDNEGATSESTATITVTGTNDAPVASADTQTIHENETLTLDVLANDTDEDHSDTTANFSLDSVQIVDGDGNPVSGQGTVSVVNNQLQFVPGSDFDSLATGETATVIVRYVMSDNEGATSESTATITVTGTNDAPVASADTQTIHENETLTLDVLANDTDEDHSDTTANFSLDSVQIVDGDGNPVSGQGTVSIVNNQLQFVPGSDFDSLATGETATVTVRYVMSDNEGATSESTATITVTGTNDAPVASADTQTIHENETLTLDVLANDTDADHNDNTANFSLDSVQIVDGDGNPVSGQGTVSIVNNQLQFVPGSDFDSLATGETATVIVRYVMSDNEGATSESTATITVTGTNDAPVARADTQTIHENETLTLDVLENDTDEDHNDNTANFSLDSVQIVDGDGNPVSGQGTVSIVNNQLQFVPGSDFDSLATGETATVTVRYVMSDNEGATSESTATITVTGTNDAPVASADTQTIHENETLTLDVLANDTDEDHNDNTANFSLESVQIVDGDGNPVSGQGTVSIVNNQLQFVPGSDFDSLATGETVMVTVRYAMSDNEGATSESTATITVTGTNDAPMASNNSFTLEEDNSYTFSVTDFGFSDVDGDSLHSVTISQIPATGELKLNGLVVSDGQEVAAADISSLVFTPVVNAHGDDYADIQFTVSDGTINSAIQTLTFDVSSVNDGPIALADGNITNPTIPILTSNTDQGFVVSASGEVNNYYEAYKAFDGVDASSANNTNSWAVAGNSGWLQVYTGEPITIWRYDLKAIGRDQGREPRDWQLLGSNDGVNFEVIDSHNSVTDWSLREVKDFELDEPATFRYFKLDISSNNGDGYTGIDGFQLFQVATADEGDSLALDVLANDIDVDIDDGPANFSLDSAEIVDADGNAVTGQGTVSIVNNQLQFDSGSDFDYLGAGDNATVQIRYTMSDNEGASSSVETTIAVNGTNDVPVASVDVATSHENQNLTVNVLANDTDMDHNDSSANFSLDSVQIVDGDGNPVSGQGTVSVVNNQLQFVPGSDFDSLDTGESATVIVRYVMSDNEGATSESTATITVTGTNDTPVASADTQTIHENETLTLDVLANDTDLDHNDGSANFTLDSVQVVDGDGNPATGQGSVRIVNNQLQFVPGSDFDSLGTGETATVTVRYVMSDNEGATSESTVTLTVTGTNDAPEIGTMAYTLEEDGSLLLTAADLLATSHDVDNLEQEQVGSALISRANTDSASGYSFVQLDPISMEGIVESWSFYSSSGAGKQVTPLLIEEVGGEYFIRGIGATRVNTAEGIQSHDFDLVSGTTEVGSGNFYIGWKDGSTTSNNSGVIEGDIASGTTSSFVRWFSTNGSTISSDMNLGGGSFGYRDYSIQFTISSVEPVDELSIESVSYSGSDGMLIDNGDGTWRFTPNEHFNGDVDLQITVTDGSLSNTAAATLSVTPVNDAPDVSGPVNVTTPEAVSTVVVTEALLLSNTGDVDGDTLSVQDVSINGITAHRHDFQSSLAAGSGGGVTINGDTLTLAGGAAGVENVVLIDTTGGGTKGSDLHLDFTVTPTSQQGTRNNFIVFDYVDANNYKAIGSFDGDETSRWVIDQYINGSATSLASYDSTDNSSLDTSRHYEIDITNNRISLTVDGVEKVAHQFSENVSDGDLGVMNTGTAVTEYTLNGADWDIYPDNEHAVYDNNDGTWTIRTGDDLSGDLTLNYNVSDGIELTAATAVVPITRPEHTIDLSSDSNITNDVLPQETTASGDSLTVTSVEGQAVSISGNTTITGEYGSLIMAADGSWTYTPDAAFNNIDLDSNLMARWTFDEGTGSTVADSSNGGSVSDDGTLDGATFVEGVSGSALSFDGIDDKVTIVSSADINTYSGTSAEDNIVSSDLTERTINLSFKIDPSNDLSSTQVLYEEGGAINGLGESLILTTTKHCHLSLGMV